MSKYFWLCALFIISVWQIGCVLNENISSADFPNPSEAVYEGEKNEAQNLFDGGITFKNTKSAHGIMTEKGVSFGSNDFESSDDVKLLRYGKLYETDNELNKAFDAALKGATKVFEKKDFANGEKMFIGAAGDSAFIVNTSGNYLYRTSSPSLRHLLAFEMKESHYFSYKSAK